jgi:hypothetical protein
MYLSIFSSWMKHVRLIVATIFLLALATAAQGQELIPPSPGKSMVYFVRSPGSGALVNFKYFDGEKYLGKFNARGYWFMRLSPGTMFFG